MIPKLSTDPLSHISSFLGNKDKHAFSQVCTTIKPIPFSPNASADKALLKHAQGIASAKRTLWTFPCSEYIKKTKLYLLDSGQIILRRHLWGISSYSQEGKKLYDVQIAIPGRQIPGYLGSNRKYFFYEMSIMYNNSFVLVKVAKVTGERQVIDQSGILPNIKFVKFFSTTSDAKMVAVSRNLITHEIVVILFDCNSNKVEYTTQTFSKDTKFFKLKQYLYLINSNSTTVLDVEDQLKPINCNVPSLGSIKVKGDKIFDFDTQDIVTCYSNDDQGNIIQEWQANVDHDVADRVSIVVSQPFIALAFDSPINSYRNQGMIAILDGENGGKVIWKKLLKRQGFSEYPLVVKFFQKGILAYFEKNSKNEDLIKLLYFHSKSKLVDTLPSIKPLGIKKPRRGHFGDYDYLLGQPDIHFHDHGIFLAHCFFTYSPMQSEIRIEKIEYQDKTANPAPIITKIGGARKRTWKNIIKFLFRRIIRNVCECAKRVFCCKK